MLKYTLAGIWRYVDRNGHHHLFITVLLACVVAYELDQMRGVVLG